MIMTHTRRICYVTYDLHISVSEQTVDRCKEIQDSLGFWIPRCSFQILCQWYLGSASSRQWDSRFHKQKFPGFNYMGRKPKHKVKGTLKYLRTQLGFNNIKKHNLSIKQLYKPRRKFSWPDAIENCCTLMKNCSIKLTMKYTANAKGNLTLLRIRKHIQGKNITRYHSLSLNLFLTILFFSATIILSAYQ